MINRSFLKEKILENIKNYPVTTIAGIRQCGKSTISREIARQFDTVFYDLENPEDYNALSNAPKLILEKHSGLVIIDEILVMPNLFPILRVLADRTDSQAKFLILGSASGKIIRNVSESLAGRVGFIDMSGFNIEEVSDNYEKLWLRGGLPKSFLANNDKTSFTWRENYIRTLLERDLPQLGINIPAITLRRFWTMLAHYHGQIWNGAELAKSLSISEPTVKRYCDILTDAFIIRQLLPWHENIMKRQVKSPKIYIRDTGLLHTLLSLPSNTVISHPKLGASWEGFAIEQIISVSPVNNFYFWSTYTGAEIDLYFQWNGNKIGIEIKYSDAPNLSRSMVSAIESLNLNRLYIVYPGDKNYPLHDKIEVIPLKTCKTIFD